VQARREEAQANYKAAIAWRERGYNVVHRRQLTSSIPA
jgi:hypothetical protein